MFGTNYYFGITKKLVTVFGTLFNDIVISRPYIENSVEKTKDVKVPLTYASLDKLKALVEGDPSKDRKFAAISPAMSFECGSPYFDHSRNLQTTLQRKYINGTSISSQFAGVPYNIDFTLYIYANQEEDGLRILENILPYFTPAMSVTVNLLPEMDYKIDIPISLNSVSVDNQSTGAVDQRREIIWTLNFTMKAMFLGPINVNKKVIRVVHNAVGLHLDDPIDLAKLRTQPGLTADGKPTSNINESIPVTEIKASDDFGFIHQIF